MSAVDWHRVLLDKQSLVFLWEVAGRTVLAYSVVFIFLKIAGRRGVRQLSLFELVVILTLGSAAGDVTFYDDVPVLPVLTVFLVMTLLYRLTTLLIEHSSHFGEWLEGRAFPVIRDGLFDLETLDKGNVSHDEFLMELRLHGAEHLGQIRLALMEVNGDVSVYFYERDEVKPGLSILPKTFRNPTKAPEASGCYACEHCGGVQQLAGHQTLVCPRCQCDQWSLAISRPRA
jgi:uncharacterized membrane protein YcaP (DUF421 family)